MIRKILFFIFCVVFLIKCKKDGPGANIGPKGNEAFTAYEGHFLEALWKLDPNWATMAGVHKYDSLLVVPNDKNREAILDFVKLQNDSLSRFEVEKLAETNKTDYRILQNQLEYFNWQITVLKSYQWDPAHYNAMPSFAYILNGHYAPLAKRLRNFYEKMDNLPAYYKEAEKQIKNPVAELTQQAIAQQTAGISIIEKDFADSLKKTNLPPADQKKMTERAKTSVEAIRTYIAWLKNLKNDHPRSFRLGKAFYEDKFKYETLSAYSAQQLFNAATDRKKQVHQEMAKLSRQLWPKYFGKKAMPSDSLELISRVLDTLSGNHTTATAFQATIEKQLPKLSAFVKAKDLITLDSSQPLIIRKQPAYFGSTAFASMSAPGPYDKDDNYYFNLMGFAGLPADDVQSYLREYNQYTLQLLCMHAAIPGHYIQQVIANKSTSHIKSIFGSDALVEGWAVYADQMMMDNGYNDDAEMKLMWYKWHLRAVCNTILDYAVHCNGMTQEQAMKLLTHEAFQQQAEAGNKWKQVTLTSVKLDSYYNGYKEIMELREAYKTKLGDKYKLKDFNEKLLSYGNAPVRLIKTLMVGNK